MVNPIGNSNPQFTSNAPIPQPISNIISTFVNTLLTTGTVTSESTPSMPTTVLASPPSTPGVGISLPQLQELVQWWQQTQSGAQLPTGSTLPSAGNSQQFLNILLQSAGNSGLSSEQLQQLLLLLGRQGVLASNLFRGNWDALSQAFVHLATSASTATPLDMTTSLAQLIYMTVTSQAAKESAHFCYEQCGECCTKECCCPSCGCPDGKCGCGSFGRFCCGLWRNLCGIRRQHYFIDLESLENLEEKYGKAVLFMALYSCGVNTLALLAGGESGKIPSLDVLEKACRACSTDFSEILSQQSMDIWCDGLQDVSSLLQNSFWRNCILKGMSQPLLNFYEDENKLKEQVRVISPWGNGTTHVANPFDMDKIANTLPKLQVHSIKENSTASLKLMTAAAVMQITARVLTEATDGGTRPCWLTSNQLMSLLAIILAHYHLYLVPGTGDLNRGNILTHPLLVSLMKDLVEIREQQHHDQRHSPGRKASYKRGTNFNEPIAKRYLDLAQKCFENTETRKQHLLDPKERDLFIVNMSKKWMKAAGLEQPSRPRTQQPRASYDLSEQPSTSGVERTPRPPLIRQPRQEGTEGTQETLF
ncbi:hypothetical protein [Candidatus Chlamydia sanziniae]|uniref:Uncharacterized protein n=1 Tax=Candidatus Chlamydia sanziniae TaxID=1806891 RepID=A0A1A9HWR4_9CHLA|nr:hypothetical protein [Candidatus Chlamydia sanziniae]ANH79137.1 hypothetical protein Cs308_0967 [Candidatus Chlamydia sanziniae]